MSSKSQTIRVEVGVELMKFVLGYDLVNLKELREKFPALKINNGKRAIYIEGSRTTQLDSCKVALDNMIVRAMADKTNYSYKKRIEKEIDCKRRAAAAANRIRDNIEAELKTRQIDDLTSRLAEKMGVSVPLNIPRPIEKTIKCGMFAGLDVESSGDEAVAE
jgi:hypothetical protein